MSSNNDSPNRFPYLVISGSTICDALGSAASSNHQSGVLLLITASLRILVVDDSEQWRRVLSSFLEQLPALQIIFEASDGLQAIEKSRELQPDLILLDVGLPQLNGIEAARQIKKIVPGARILFLSENRCPDIVRAALHAGGCGYVVKSDAGDDLLPALEAVMANRQFVRITTLLADQAGGINGT